MTKTMVIEPVRAFNGLDVLVARDEGLFVAEGLDLQCASPQPGALRSAAEGTLANPVTNQGRRLTRGSPYVPGVERCSAYEGLIQRCGALAVPPQ